MTMRRREVRSMPQKPHKAKEPLFHIAKRDAIVWWKAWGIRIAAILMRWYSAGLCPIC